MPLTFADLLDRARSLAGRRPRAVLGITGAPGAGKTTLAEHLVRALEAEGAVSAAHVPMDGFHLADAELDRLGLRDRKGAPATFDAAGYAALLRRLREESGEVVYAPGFERVLEQPLAGAIPVPPTARLVVTEGNYLLLEEGSWAQVRTCLDEVWFCEIDERERVARLVARHEEFGKDHDAAVAWVLGTDQRNADLVAATRRRADLVVPVSALPRMRWATRATTHQDDHVNEQIDGVTDGVAEALAGELELLTPRVRASRELAGRLLDPDFTEVGASGRRWDRETMLSSLPQMAGASVDDPVDEPTGMTATVLAPGLVHVTYELNYGGRRTRRSSIWRKLDAGSGWRLYYHQGTIVPAE